MNTVGSKNFLRTPKAITDKFPPHHCGKGKTGSRGGAGPGGEAEGKGQQEGQFSAVDCRGRLAICSLIENEVAPRIDWPRNVAI